MALYESLTPSGQLNSIIRSLLAKILTTPLSSAGTNSIVSLDTFFPLSSIGVNLIVVCFNILCAVPELLSVIRIFFDPLRLQLPRLKFQHLLWHLLEPHMRL